jgi:hypothetical protein
MNFLCFVSSKSQTKIKKITHLSYRYYYTPQISKHDNLSILYFIIFYCHTKNKDKWIRHKL